MNTLTPESKKPASPRRAPVFPGRVGVLQRKCACGGSAASGGECEECKKEKLQRRKGQGEEPESVPGMVHDVLSTPGNPMDRATRGFMEPQFGHDFGNVRVHADDRAAESARSVNALAYTVGLDVVFGAGQYVPGRPSGQRLLAHELTHVVQQGHAGRNLQRKLEIGRPDDAEEHEADRVADRVVGSTGMPPPPPSSGGSGVRIQRAVDKAPTAQSTGAAAAHAGVIAEDDAREVGPGQMRKTEFLEKLRAHVCSVADSVLVSVGRTAKGCPVIERWIGHLRQRNVQYIERGLRKYASPGPQAGAQEFITAVGERVREGVTRWARTGDVSGVPPELMSEMGGGGIAGATGSAVGGIAGGIGGAISGIGQLFAKGRDGGARAGNPAAIQAQLSGGSPLEGGVRTRMESAFGYSFSRVRVHNDPKAGRLSSDLNARAFTIGSDVAFASGEYRPGTLIGDALIAHELAHVIQQGSGTQAAGAGYSSMEEDADRSAVGAMISSRGGAMLANAMPSLRSGLKLQRCGDGKKPEEKADEKTGEKTETACTAQAIGTHAAECMARSNEQPYGLDKGIHYPGNFKEELKKAGKPELWSEDYRKGYADPTYFDPLSGSFDWRLKKGVSASAGIKKWLTGLTIAECNSTVVACEYDSFRAAAGDQKFDEQFGSASKELPDEARMRIKKTGTSGTPIGAFMTPTEAAKSGDIGTFGNRPAEIGEWYYFSNHPMYLLKHPGNDWQGENAVYAGRNDAGEQTWTGLGANKRTEQALLDEMIEYYNSSPYGHDLDVLEAIKKVSGGKLPAQYQPGFYPDQVDGPKILNAPEYTLENLFTHKKTTRKGGFRGKAGMRLDEERVRKVKE